MQDDLIFSGVSPVVINKNGSAEDIYAPVRSSSCDINIVSREILDDIYTAKKNGIGVKVTKTTSEVVYNRRSIRGQGYYNRDDQGTFQINVYDGDTSYVFWVDAITYKFVDVDGDLNILCNISNSTYGFLTNVWIKARTGQTPTNRAIYFDLVNKWSLDTDDRYFYVGENSYKVYSDNDAKYIDRWNGSGWTSMGHYYKYTSTGLINGHCDFDSENVVHFLDGTVEMIVPIGVYTFYQTNSDAGWKYIGRMYQLDGSDFELYGKNARKTNIYGENGQIETIDVIGNENYGQDYYFYRMNHTTHTIEELVELPSGYDPMNSFNDSDNNLFIYNGSTGLFYWLCGETWEGYTVVGSNFSSLMTFWWIVEDSILITYYTYPDSSLVREQFRWNPKPRIYYESETIYHTNLLWEGYKVPNTYTQAVTLNLDNIQMTAIDPVSCLKYVKVKTICEKNQVKSYKELIGAALAAVKLYTNELWVERSVSYGGSYSSGNGLLDLKIQTSNFWDESSQSSNVYNMIEELLRPFCMTLVYDDAKFQIYNVNKTQGVRVFDRYTIEDLGGLTLKGSGAESTIVYDDEDWTSNNTQQPALEIGSTYNKVTAVASSMIPNYLEMVYDVVNYNQKNKYDILDLNVQRNKTKGWVGTTKDTDDHWYYIWNGVYTNEIYNLESNGDYVNGYLNINKAYQYLTGGAGHPSDYGSILNFYGGAVNPNATGKDQDVEKSVSINKRITAYAADNGTPLEFLEGSDLVWSFDSHYDPNEGTMEPALTFDDPTNSLFGSSKDIQYSTRVVYKQDATFMLSGSNEFRVGLDLVQSYSRTGIDSKIDIMQNNDAYNFLFYCPYQDEDYKWVPFIYTCKMKYFPDLWNASKVKVDTWYFNRFKTSGSGLLPVRPKLVEDRRRVDMYLTLSDNSILQFNGKEWVADTTVRQANAFYLVKIMNNEYLYHTDHRYDIIQTSDYVASQDTDAVNRDSVTGRYSLTDEAHTHYIDTDGGYSTTNAVRLYRKTYTTYWNEGNAWYDMIIKSDKGQLTVKLPLMDDSVTLTIRVYNSTLLGMTGSTGYDLPNYSRSVKYSVTGTGMTPDEQGGYIFFPLTENNCENYGAVGAVNTYVGFLPYNATYVKAEHLDLDINLEIPESNLGQMFSQSDIEYTLEGNTELVEGYEMPSFLVNTYNQFVNSSFSYLLYGSGIADPDEFIINGIAGRPEYFTLQAYMNWLSKVRKIYDKTMVLNSTTASPISNVRKFIKSPEVGNKKMMVISDTIDVKTNRHNIKAVECEGLDVTDVQLSDSNEIPRQARNERYRYTSAKKQ